MGALINPNVETDTVKLNRQNVLEIQMHIAICYLKMHTIKKKVMWEKSFVVHWLLLECRENFHGFALDKFIKLVGETFGVN